MYLSGKKVFGSHHASPRTEDGFHVEHIQLALGYWRKHQALHDHIVDCYAYEQKDDCNPIELTADQIVEVINAIKNGAISSDQYDCSDEEWEQMLQEDAATFGKALAWMTMTLDPPEAKPHWKSIIYQASW
jgi:hypothetical protein